MIPSCATLHKKAIIKYNSIVFEQGAKSNGSMITLHDKFVDMQAQLDKKLQSFNPKKCAATNDCNQTPDTTKKPRASLSTLFLQDITNSAGKPYKVGDTHQHKGVTYYFCDTPNHQQNLRWHQHTAKICTIRQQ